MNERQFRDLKEGKGRKIQRMMMIRTHMLQETMWSQAKVPFHDLMYNIFLSLSQSLVWEFFSLLVTKTYCSQHM